MKFVKMHGLGNDYVFVDCFRNPVPKDPAALSRAVAAQHTGIGSDGLILMLPCEDADARMRIFNADGSEGEMCGNGIRCMAKYLYDEGIVRKENMNILSGGILRGIQVRKSGGVCTGARVDMGPVCFEAAKIPVNAPENRVKIDFSDGKSARFTCLSLGNPHAVTLERFPASDAEFFHDGAWVENHALFPNRVNASFCRVDDRHHVTARIWERGSGATRACGSGACATWVAAYLEGACAAEGAVALPGGELFIEYAPEQGHVFMTGPATLTFVGEWMEI